MLLAFFDDKFKKEDIADSWDKFNNFEEFKKTEIMSITDSTFHQKYKQIANDITITNFCF